MTWVSKATGSSIEAVSVGTGAGVTGPIGASVGAGVQVPEGVGNGLALALALELALADGSAPGVSCPLSLEGLQPAIASAREIARAAVRLTCE